MTEPSHGDALKWSLEADYRVSDIKVKKVEMERWVATELAKGVSQEELAKNVKSLVDTLTEILDKLNRNEYRPSPEWKDPDAVK